jgi:hypothetical protein
MDASGVLAYSLIAESDRDPLVIALVVALISAVVAVITTMMSNASANRRQRLELRSRKGHSSTVGLLWIAIAILSVGIFYVATRSNDTADVASAGTAPSSALPAETTPTTATAPVATAAATTVVVSSFPACEALTVQIGAIGPDKTAEFATQAQLLIQAMPELRELHSAAGEPCGTGLTQFYFGPFPNADQARTACFGIGHVLQDNTTKFTAFNNPDTGQINYPFYRIGPKTPAPDGNGDTLLCNPENEQG